jgi:hypothetical protein
MEKNGRRTQKINKMEDTSTKQKLKTTSEKNGRQVVAFLIVHLLYLYRNSYLFCPDMIFKYVAMGVTSVLANQSYYK